MADAFGAGASFRDFLANAAAKLSGVMPGIHPQEAAAIPGMLGAVGNFYNGMQYGTAPAAPAVHPAVAAAAGGPLPAGPDAYSPSAVDAHRNGHAMTAQDVVGLGQLSPAAAAVLKANSPLTLAAAQAAQSKDAAAKAAATLQGTPTWAQMMAGYAAGHGGNISLRAIDALAGATQKGAAASSYAAKQPSIKDIAGAEAMQAGNELLQYRQAQARAAGDKDAEYKAGMDHLELLKALAGARDDALANMQPGGS